MNRFSHGVPWMEPMFIGDGSTGNGLIGSRATPRQMVTIQSRWDGLRNCIPESFTTDGLIAFDTPASLAAWAAPIQLVPTTVP